MENEKEWEKIRLEKEIREDLARLKMISSHFAANLISEEELQTMIQEEINELCLVAIITDLVYQGEMILIAIDDENYQYIFYDEREEQAVVLDEDSLCILEKLNQRELTKKFKKIDKPRLIQMTIKMFQIRKEQNNTTNRGKTNVSLFLFKILRNGKMKL